MGVSAERGHKQNGCPSSPWASKARVAQGHPPVPVPPPSRKLQLTSMGRGIVQKADPAAYQGFSI